MMSVRKRIHLLVLGDGTELPFKVLRSAAGYYIGTEIDGELYSRESLRYWDCQKDAETALKSEDWIRRTVFG
ncbi:hypothetical protein [Gilliamella apis]|uniref:Uncharacterized protein n=1 Tax=Gilliamella apis TaxID=1970738 RepID=A0A242NX88_9GAMM|nr:hypothetical protein [Gilliamella apis]OTQ53728.1 hypothetical protein B6D06_00600 [Gilliamella apis]